MVRFASRWCRNMFRMQRQTLAEVVTSPGHRRLDSGQDGRIPWTALYPVSTTFLSFILDGSSFSCWLLLILLPLLYLYTRFFIVAIVKVRFYLLRSTLFPTESWFNASSLLKLIILLMKLLGESTDWHNLELNNGLYKQEKWNNNEPFYLLRSDSGKVLISFSG